MGRRGHRARRSTPNKADVQRGIESVRRLIADRLQCDPATLRLVRAIKIIDVPRIKIIDAQLDTLGPSGRLRYPETTRRLFLVA